MSNTDDAPAGDAEPVEGAAEPSEPSWEERNNAYLTAALHWLRLRLTKLAGTDQSPSASSQRSLPSPALTPPPATVAEAPPPPAPAGGAPKGRRWLKFLWPDRERDVPTAATEPPAPAAAEPDPPEIASPVAVDLPSPIASALTIDEVADAADGMQAPAGDEEPALVELARRLGLSRFERDILLLAAATELDPMIAELCAQAQGHGGRSLPTFGLALQLFDDPEWEALAPHRPLRRLQLVTLAGASDSVVNAQLRADERLVNLLKGLDHIDERLSELLVPMAAQSTDLPAARSHSETVEMIARWAGAAPSSKAVVCLTGPHSTSKRIIAEQVAATLSLFIVRLPVTNLPPPGPELNGVIRLWERDSLLSPLSLYLDASDQSGELSQDARLAASRLLARVRGLVFVDSRETWTGLDSTAMVVEVTNPNPREQRAVWDASLPPAHKQLADDLAAHFDLDPLTIHQLASAVGQGGGGAEETDEAQQRKALWRSVLVSTRPSLDLLGKRAQPKVGASDLILPPNILEQLDRIKEQVRHRATVYNDWGLSERMSRGLGISALFAGESGTGKTLAAEVIAADLGLDLYRIDLSGVVSKYIGETEKNLRRVFDAAEQGGTILCFDEADALFGKRSEVKDSHDRYANIEVNYLLQRMEDYRGLAILTTNMKSSLDHAFTRRIRFVVDFPFPGPAERERIWRGAFVGAVSTDRLDFKMLARLTLSGGGIHNVAVNATFAAASDPEHALTMPMILGAARLEYRKSGLPVNESAFQWTEPPEHAPALPAPAPDARGPSPDA